MKYSRGNYFFIGGAIAFVIIAFVQLKMDGLLPAWLYSLIAFASLSIAFFEMIKMLTKELIRVSNNCIEVIKHKDSIARRHIELFEGYKSLEDDVGVYKALLTSDKDIVMIKKCQKRKALAERLLNIVTILEVIFVTAMVIIMPLKTITYDIFNTRVINSVTILTFGMMFINLFLSSIFEEDKSYYEDKHNADSIYSDYYTEVIEKIVAENAKSNDQ